MPRKSPTCPNCGKKRVRPIIYGEPALSTFEASKRGELIIGGCAITEGMPLWDCSSCGSQFGSLDHADIHREPRALEQWLEIIETMMPRPVTKRGPNEFVGGNPETVIVRVSPRRITIMEAAINWADPSRPELIGEPFAEVPLRTRAVRVANLIARAHGKRLSRYRWCPMCYQTMEPEQMDESLCHGCRSKHFGVVY